VLLMDTSLSVIVHTSPAERTHSRSNAACGKYLTMDEGEIFIRNLIEAQKKSGLKEAELSLKAGLNRRAVTDLREGRVASPKISTVFKLAKALNLDPAEMMGLGSRVKIQAELADFLSQYDPKDQERFLVALSAIAPPPAEQS